MKEAAGLLLHRRNGAGLDVLLVHPSGNYNRKAPWSIPKGELDFGEDAESAARRETLEETGIDVAGPLIALGFIDYVKSRKRVHAFAAEAPADACPRPASWEIDRAEFMSLNRARALLHPDQTPLLDRLEQLV